MLGSYQGMTGGIGNYGSGSSLFYSVRAENNGSLMIFCYYFCAPCFMSMVLFDFVQSLNDYNSFLMRRF